jgi:flagellar hook assembly protein FlgD
VVRHKVVDRAYKAGDFTVTWGGFDDAHVRVPHGIYTVTVTATSGDSNNSAAAPLVVA